MQNLIVPWTLGAVVVTGAATDLWKGKIPNWLTLPAMAAGLVINCFVGAGLRPAFYGMLSALGVYFVFYVLWGRGAGDGKLMGAVGAFVGWPQIAMVMLVVALVGGVVALALAWQRGVLFQVVRNTLGILADMVTLRWRPENAVAATLDRRMPHGPVIAAGTLVFLLFSPR